MEMPLSGNAHSKKCPLEKKILKNGIRKIGFGKMYLNNQKLLFTYPSHSLSKEITLQKFFVTFKKYV